MILDLHLHSERSDDSRASVEAYLKLLQRKRDERPLDGIVLTEHRQFDPTRDFRGHADPDGVGRALHHVCHQPRSFGQLDDGQHVRTYFWGTAVLVTTRSRGVSNSGGWPWPVPGESGLAGAHRRGSTATGRNARRAPGLRAPGLPFRWRSGVLPRHRGIQSILPQKPYDPHRGREATDGSSQEEDVQPRW